MKKNNLNMTSIDKKDTYNFIPDVPTRLVHCDYCGKTKRVPSSYISYTLDKKVFCSWDCKAKYKRLIQRKEEELNE
jgi:hypothetical protein